MKRTLQSNLGGAALLASFALSSGASAYYVEINGIRYDATSQPAVSVQGTSSGLVVNISGGINLGTSQATTTTAAVDSTSVDNSGSSDSSGGGDDSSDSSATTATPTTSTPAPTGSTGSDACSTDSRVLCASEDYGPALVGSKTINVDILSGAIVSIPFSISDYRGSSMYGLVSTVAKTAVSLNGHTLRSWFSLEAGGKPIDGQSCFITPKSLDFSHRWNQGKDYAGYCRLPSEKSTVYKNYAVCSTSADDPTCRSSSAKFPGGTVRLLSTSRRIRY